MKYFKIQEGIVFTEVCGEYVLVPLRQAWDACPCGKILNTTGAFFWRLIEKNGDVDWMVEQAAQHYHELPERIRPGLGAFLRELEQAGFLYEVDIYGD